MVSQAESKAMPPIVVLPWHLGEVAESDAQGPLEAQRGLYRYPTCTRTLGGAEMLAPSGALYVPVEAKPGTASVSGSI